MAVIKDARGRLPHGEGFSVPLEVIEFVPGRNPRNMTYSETRAHIEDIKAQIKVRGWDADSTIMGSWDKSEKKFYLVAGHCRTTAAWELKAEGHDIEAIFGRLEPRGFNDYKRMLIAMKDPSKSLNKFEYGDGIMKMVALLGLGDQKGIAKIALDLNKPHQWIHDCLDIQAAPKPIFDAIRDDKMSVTEGLRVIREDGPLLAAEAVRKAERAFPGQKITRKRIEAVQPPPKPPISITPYAVRVAEVWSEQTEEFRASMPDEFRLVLDALRGRVR